MSAPIPSSAIPPSAIPSSAVMPTYARAPVAFVRGAGCRLWDREGRVHLDFAAGIAVNVLGHAHPRL